MSALVALIAMHSNGEPLFFLVAFLVVAFIAMVAFGSHSRANEARDKHAKARRLAERGETQLALRLVREAKDILPRGKHGHATPEFVDMATFAAVLEERVRNERSEAARIVAPVAPVVTPQPPSAPSQPRSVARAPRQGGKAALRPVTAGDRVGEYILEESIGVGGFGEVWSARHSVFDTAAAVKIPSAAHAGHIDGLRRLGKIQRSFDDPRIVKILGADLEADPPYVAMELVRGSDLRRLLEREERLAPSRALEIFEEVLAALAVAHGAGVVHRDLKPENILVADDGAVKVTDFELGSARQEAGAALLSSGLATTGPGGIVGTLAYMAPEQLAGEAVDARADVYALGVILFEMLTGERPSPGDRPSQLVDGLPPACDELFLRCYTRLEKRFRSARAALDALAAATSTAQRRAEGSRTSAAQVAVQVAEPR